MPIERIDRPSIIKTREPWNSIIIDGPGASELIKKAGELAREKNGKGNGNIFDSPLVAAGINEERRMAIRRLSGLH